MCQLGIVHRPIRRQRDGSRLLDYDTHSRQQLQNARDLVPDLLRQPRQVVRGVPVYQNAPALYRLRLSAAVKRSAAALDRIALGVRVALLDKADLRTNPAYLRDATEMTGAINRLFAEQNRETPPAPGHELTADDLSPERLEKLAAVAQRLKARVEQRAWNADILDVAAGALAGARDSSGQDLRLTQYAGWLTYGKGDRAVGPAAAGTSRFRDA